LSLPRPADLDTAFAFFESRTNLEKGLPPGNPNRVYRLDRMRALCSAFGAPQTAYRVVHVAGSKGKGSTAAYLAALLKAAGRRVGVYGSPHLVDYRERFRIEGEPFDEAAALEDARFLMSRLEAAEAALPGEGGATTFELLTLFGFLFFRNAGCDTVVLETGLGGRLDATNVVPSPEAAVFTPVEREHVEILGKRLTRIAGEKAGILKPGTRAYSARQAPSVRRVFRRRCRNLGLPFTVLTDRVRRIEAVPPGGARSPGESGEFSFGWIIRRHNGDSRRIDLAPGGRIQAENAALALEVAADLEPALLRAETHDTIRAVLAAVRLPGRFQLLEGRPPIVLDGAHTPRSMDALRDAFAGMPAVRDAEAPPLLVFGCALGKDHRRMADQLCGGRRPVFMDVIVSTPGSFKPSDPSAVAAAFRRTGARVSLIADPAEAWTAALEESAGIRPILVTGSFFMAGEIARIHRFEGPLGGTKGPGV